MKPRPHRDHWQPGRRPVAIGIAIGLAIAALLAATALDGWAYRVLVMRDVYDHDWGRMLRIVGFLPTWAIVSAALALNAPESRSTFHSSRWRAFLPLIAATIGGLVAEVLKLVLRRERPEFHAGAYVYRSWSDHPLSSAGLSLPSSHALVAFAAAAVLARMYPRARALWYALAAGCALTRVLARAHFLSDVTLSAIIAWGVASLVWRSYERSSSPVTIP